ncbi:hypothetical protein FQN60_009533 [Etheostoma spectabile]|uniref:Uncharacterized protein n=1 Tax=Etheostoma spectabile TaxID=54343 RepID=A0A5J5DJ73_9PERO|nr:hypothetical protein FQN60_009533 [Etheostoma spectabile]
MADVATRGAGGYCSEHHDSGWRLPARCCSAHSSAAGSASLVYTAAVPVSSGSEAHCASQTTSELISETCSMNLLFDSLEVVNLFSQLCHTVSLLLAQSCSGGLMLQGGLFRVKKACSNQIPQHIGQKAEKHPGHFIITLLKYGRCHEYGRRNGVFWPGSHIPPEI